MPEIQGNTDASGRRFAVVASRFNELVTERLVQGATACLLQHGARSEDVDVVWVPGAWELTGAASRTLRSGRYAAIVAVGCVIRGETPHFEYVAGEAARGLGALQREGPIPVTFGVLTTDDAAQAMARAGGNAGNKGWDAALAALEMVSLYELLEESSAGT